MFLERRDGENKMLTPTFTSANSIMERNLDRVKRLRGDVPATAANAVAQPSVPSPANPQSAGLIIGGSKSNPFDYQSQLSDTTDRYVTAKTKALDDREQAIAAREAAQPGTEGLKDIVSAGGYTPEQKAILQRDANARLASSIETAQNALSRRFAGTGQEGTGVQEGAFQTVLGDFAKASQAAGLDIDKESLNAYFKALSQLSSEEQQVELARLQAQLQEEAKGSGLAGFIGDVVGTFAGGFAGKAAEKLASSVF